jgi:hypothetical protein
VDFRNGDFATERNDRPPGVLAALSARVLGGLRFRGPHRRPRRHEVPASKPRYRVAPPLERNFENPLSSEPGTLAVDLSIGGSINLSPLPAAPVFGGFFSDGKGYAIAQHAADYSCTRTENSAGNLGLWWTPRCVKRKVIAHVTRKYGGTRQR